MIKKIFLIFIFILTLTNLLSAEEYFSILKYNNVNLRQGPSKNYPVKIFYKKKYLPVIVQDRSDNFRKIRDHEDNTGWVHVSQLSQKKAALVSDDQVVVFKNSTVFSEPLVILERGRLCLVSKCK
jgi:SH3-like domain-containing protein